MATMQPPKAFYGYLDESLVLVLKGQVRYMTAKALRSFLDHLLAKEVTDTVLIDLRELDAIDSTGMGLLARLGRFTLEHGRRAVIVCSVQDVVTCLQSAAFDSLFIMLEKWPFDEEAAVLEVPLDARDLVPEIIGHIMLDAHRELVSLSDDNRRNFGAVVTALESELDRRSSPTYQ
jgi:anti-anti-sigma factor